MQIDIDLTGIDEALKRLKRYLNPERNRLMQKAYNAAAKYIRDLAKRYVSVQSGTLKRSMTVKIKIYNNRMTIVAMIGPKSWYKGEYKGNKRISHFYAHLVEGGRKGFYQKFRPFKRFGDETVVTRFVKPARKKPFVGKSARTGQRRALDIIASTIKAGFEK